MISSQCVIGVVILIFYQQSAGQPTTPFFRSDYKFFEESQSFYKFHTRSSSWKDAKDLCELEGATLFYPENKSEFDAVVKYWRSDDNLVFTTIHIGVSDTFVKGVFETVDGKHIDEMYMNWNKGEPNNALHHCVIMHLNGYMDDMLCVRQYPFICRKKFESLEWNDQCNLPDRGYLYSETTKKCYKVHDIPKTWTEAYRTCIEEQSNLAVIDDEQEEQYLTQLTITATNSSCVYDEPLFLGYHKRDLKGWRKIENDTNYVAPDPCDKKDKSCGAISDRGLSAVSCNWKCKFICEHDVPHSETTHEAEEIEGAIDETVEIEATTDEIVEIEAPTDENEEIETPTDETDENLAETFRTYRGWPQQYYSNRN